MLKLYNECLNIPKDMSTYRETYKIAHAEEINLFFRELVAYSIGQLLYKLHLNIGKIKNDNSNVMS